MTALATTQAPGGGGRGRRGSGRRRLRELTRSVVDTMELLEEVRSKHADMTGVSKALVQVIKLGLKICMSEPEDRVSAGSMGGGAGAGVTKGSGNTSFSTATDITGISSPAASSLTVAGVSSSCSASPSSFSGVAASSTGQSGARSKVASGGGISSGSDGAASSGSARRNGVGAATGGGGGWGGPEESLPLGTAVVLWELECCAAQIRLTLMNLNEGRPNHFGVFRASVYIKEICILEEKVVELVELAANPREEKNASLGTTVAAGMRNCPARLWWARQAGENAESMLWDDFTKAFQDDFGEQIPKSLDIIRMHIATRGPPGPRCPPVPPDPLQPSTMAALNASVGGGGPVSVGRGGRKRGRGFVGSGNVSTGVGASGEAGLRAGASLWSSTFGSSTVRGDAAVIRGGRLEREGRVGLRSATARAAAADDDAAAEHHSPGQPGAGAAAPIPPNYTPMVPSSRRRQQQQQQHHHQNEHGGERTPVSDLGENWAAAAAAIEASTAASVAAFSNVNASTGSSQRTDPTAADGVGARQAGRATSRVEPSVSSSSVEEGEWEKLVMDAEPTEGSDDVEYEATDEGSPRVPTLPTGLRTMTSAPTTGQETSPRTDAGRIPPRSLLGRRAEYGALAELPSNRSKGTTRKDGGRGMGKEDGSDSSWRVTAAKYEHVTWSHGGLYEAFQALADPRRVVYVMGVVDDGPHHEGGGEGEDGDDAGPVIVQGLLGLCVQQVCCGGQHAAVLTDCGEIYTWGRGGFGRLGHGSRDSSEKPKRVEALEGIPCVQVACGFAYTAAVTASGELYTWGAGENGRLGLGDVEDRHTPSKVDGLHSKVREVYAGSVHSCVLTREGTVYSFGKHEYTGHGDQEDVLEPRLIPAFSGGSEAPVRQISVGPGGYHTMALTCQGQVYAWGHNRVAQLGIGNSYTVPRNGEGAHFLPSPQLVESLLGMNIVKVVAGWGHSAALTMSGQLYVCGRNFQGQLGLGSPQRFPQNERGHPFQADFCLIERLAHLKIRQIACGGEHSVAVAENGEVWSFGAGQKGQLGHDTTTREDFPRLVERLKSTRREIRHVACGNNCTLVLAGGVAFPTLFERTAAVIRSNPALWADVGSLGVLPPSVVDFLNGSVEDGETGVRGVQSTS